MLNSNNYSSSSSSSVKCLKYFLNVVTILLTLLGCCLIGLGTFIQVTDSLQKPDAVTATVVIAIGIGNTFIGLFGCCIVLFSRSKNNCIYITLTAVLLVGLLCNVVVCSWLLLHRNALAEDSRLTLRQAIESYFTNDQSKQFMNNVQSRLHCCGADNGLGDYGSHSFFQNNSASDIGYTSVCEMQFFGQPCHQPLAEYLSEKVILILSLLVASVFLLVNIIKLRILQ